ncbi:EamA family transporter [Chitinophaga qingshengii]|uniref:EamA family transporter n=1 Tax=Chitinophaga qingshengii TaxID=1569794 RepID=A0ABR7TKF6_9BACT|nr:DMT family transporter [Chitinophaga qingshengii]MBC9930011.1 EamA family transporter [Chitinophaga qingshengii]
MKNLKYSFMVLLGGILYGTMSSFVKLSYSRGYYAAEIAFSQALLAALLLGTCLLIAGKGEKPDRKGLLSLLLVGSSAGLTNFLYYQSVSYISASLAIVILMQFTWFSLLLEWLIFRQRPGRPALVTVAFILVGTVMAGDLLQPGLSFSWQGLMLALASSFTYAVYIVANSRVGKGVRWQAKSTLIMTGSALTIFLINAPVIVSANHFGYTFLSWALFLAIVGTTIPTALFAAGIPKIGAGTSAILMTIEFPVAILCAYLVLQEAISPLQITGMMIMLAAISVMNYYKSLKN